MDIFIGLSNVLTLLLVTYITIVATKYTGLLLKNKKYETFNFVDVSSKNTKKWKLA